VVVLLNCGESAAQLLAQFEGTARASHGPERGRMDLRTYGIGAQILRECGVHKMQLMGNPRRMPSMDRVTAWKSPVTCPVEHPHTLHSTRNGTHTCLAQTRENRRRPTAGRQEAAIGIVQARFNAGITDALAAGLQGGTAPLGVRKHIDHVQVPGALEVPVALQALAEKAKYDALIALGCIIRGETYHFELVANESGAGVSRMSRWTTSCPSPTRS
jgi:6,7-dimethyl-8-ribityllumazine synthase